MGVAVPCVFTTPYIHTPQIPKVLYTQHKKDATYVNQNGYDHVGCEFMILGVIGPTAVVTSLFWCYSVIFTTTTTTVSQPRKAVKLLPPLGLVEFSLTPIPLNLQGSVLGWGSNEFGQTGCGSEGPDVLHPRPVKGLGEQRVVM